MEERLVNWLAESPELIRMLFRSYTESRLFWDSIDGRPVLVADASTVGIFQGVGHLVPELMYSTWE
jgi:hypothetical protein